MALTWNDLEEIDPAKLKALLALDISQVRQLQKGSEITGDQVAKWLGARVADQHMNDVAEAVTHYVENLPNIDRTEGGSWAPTTALGATMLAARLYKRRNSANGIESFAEVGNTYVSRYDSDIARLLKIEAFNPRKPRVG